MLWITAHFRGRGGHRAGPERSAPLVVPVPGLLVAALLGTGLAAGVGLAGVLLLRGLLPGLRLLAVLGGVVGLLATGPVGLLGRVRVALDRKSTRLNS